ncbi:coenzyme F390 synthetase [Amycolatopsis ultiminotia]|uniref:Coenzyme F390 synthetase n=1 Tax=Amycolatopsis ultiminotia TaxID=543629 RepID=A0ABP6XYH4_9PSEU
MDESAVSPGRDIRRVRKQGMAVIERRQRVRLAAAVAAARAGSPYYRELYRGLPERIEDPAVLPVTDKKTLMARFDDWPTDREITYHRVRSVVDDPGLIGTRFAGKYLVATTSGTTGSRGIFVFDERYLAVAGALGSQAMGSWLGFRGAVRAAARGLRFAQLVATGGHYAGFAGYTRTVAESRWRKRILKPFSVHKPIPELVAELDEYRPAVVIGYAAVIMQLAAEQQAGRLHIDPVLVVPAGETMTTADTTRIGAAFRATVATLYSCTECTYLSNGCAYGWYHVNSDWAVLEPVDAQFRPTPPGEWSDTVLISNLANRVQPFLRYNLGDSVLLRPDPCPCGNPLPALRVRGRSADILTFPSGHGKTVAFAPLTFSTLFDRTPGVELFQIEQTAPATLRVRLAVTRGADPDTVWRTVHSELQRLLADHDLPDVTVVRARQPPPQQPGGGKYRPVVPLAESRRRGT